MELHAVNGRALEDFLDWEFLAADECFVLSATLPDGDGIEYDIVRPEGLPLGVTLEAPRIRRCANHCDFCFVDGNPKGLRTPLYIRDDDYRLSFRYGNFATLTNLKPWDLERIVAYRLSPLYVSVHATDPTVRRWLLRNPEAPEIVPQLRALAQQGIKFHTQVVLIPGANDGAELVRTLTDLAALGEPILSVSVVPVALTEFSKRDLVQELTGVQCRAALATVERFATRAIVSAVAPGEASLAERAGREPLDRRERGAALHPRELLDEVSLGKLGERHRHHRNREDRLPQRGEVGEGAHQLCPVVCTGDQHDLGVKLDPLLRQRPELGHDLRRFGVTEQPAAHRRVGGVHGDIERRQPICDDPLQVPRLEVGQRRKVAVPERQPVIVVPDVQRRPQTLGVAVHEAEVAVVGAATDPRCFQRDAEGEPLRSHDVVLDAVAVGQRGGQHEALVRGQELPIQEVLERATVDRVQLHSRDEPEFRAERARRHRLDTNHCTYPDFKDFVKPSVATSTQAGTSVER